MVIVSGTSMLNFSQAADNNKQAILDVLAEHMASPATVLEIGSGSGQHALHFSAQLTHLMWQPSELDCGLEALRSNLDQAAIANVADPVVLDVCGGPWPADVDCVYTANTLHIMSWSMVIEFMRGVGQVLGASGSLYVYGPFRYNGDFTTESNARFDGWLKERDPASGVRDFEALDALALAEGLRLAVDVAMPANNQLLIWHRG
jgi:SAM-dependent methyltransferase